MDRGPLLTLDRTQLVNGIANNVHDTAECTLAHRNRDGLASVLGLHAAHKTIRGAHGDGADLVITKV